MMQTSWFKIQHRLAAVALLAGITAVNGLAQFGGREFDSVIYLFAGKGKVDFKIVPGTTSNAGVPGTFQVINPATLPSAPLSADFAAKRVQVLHKETGDLFELITQTENVPTPRARVVAPSKVLTLGGLLRDANEGSVSLAPLDVTGGLYVPYIPGVAQGPDVGLQLPKSLLWTSSDSASPLVQLPDGTHSDIGPAGLTGIELEAFAGAALYFSPWVNMSVAYPTDTWPLGIDLKIIDDDPQVGNSARLFRLRSAKSTPFFTLAANTHFYVLEGSVSVAAPGTAPVTIPAGSYAFIPKGYAISVSNPRFFSPNSPPNTDGN